MLHISKDLQTSPLAAAPPVLLTVRQFSERHPAFSTGALRNLIFLAAPRTTSRGQLSGNGLAPAIKRIGRKVLIDEARFFEWLYRLNGHIQPEQPNLTLEA